MPPFDAITLHTPRLFLRPLEAGDAQALMTIYADPKVSRFLSRPAWTSLDQAHESIARAQRYAALGEGLRLGVLEQGQERVIGDVTLFDFMPQCRRAEMGYVLAADRWGRGFMHEALTALVDHAFSALDLNRIEADIDPRNTGSARSLERLGFLREGFLRERWIVAGEVSDTALYGLLRRDWAGRAAG
ncbi:MAG: GNAT family N-acetyltransferase [Rubrivivax sp.]|nr:GNAT family N-acetyltransferase [Rubrivivax sp.]